MRRLIAVTALLAACNPNDPGANEKAASFYAAPTWTAQVNPNETAVLLGFDEGMPTVLLNTSDDSQPDGTTSLVVSSSAGTSIAAGDVGAAFANDALYTFAFADATTPNVLVPAHACPGVAVNANAVRIAGAWSNTDAAIATFTWDPTSGVATEPSSYDVRGATLGGVVALGAGPCDVGVATLDSSTQLYLSDGPALVWTSPQLAASGGDAISLALPQPAAPIAPSDVNGAFGGVLYDGTRSRIVTGTLDGGTASITNEGTAVAQLSLTAAAVQNGQLLATLTLGTDVEPAICAITDTAPTVLACASETPTGHLVSLTLGGITLP